MKQLIAITLCLFALLGESHAMLRGVASSSGGGSTSTGCTATASPGGIVYVSSGACVSNSNFTTDGAGAVSASASVTAPAFVGGTVNVTGAITSGAQVNAVTLRASGLTSGRFALVGATGVIQDNSAYTFSGSTASFSGVLSLGSGTAVAPVLANSGSSNTTGLFFDGGGRPSFSIAGTAGIAFAAAATLVPSGHVVQWNSSALGGGGPDLGVSRCAANIACIGNGTAADSSGSIKGVTTNSNAPALSIGEIMTASVASSGATVSMSTGTAVTAVSSGATVTAGDWDVDGVVCYITAVNTSITLLSEGVSTTNNTFGALGTYTSDQIAAMVPLATSADEICRAVPTTRVSLSGTSTVYLVTKARFTVGTLSSYGFMRLRRMR